MTVRGLSSVQPRASANGVLTCHAAAAVQDELDAQVDVVAGAPARDLDAVPEGGESGVRPARAAVLGDVLVEHVGQARLAVLVVPVELLGQVGVGEVAGTGREGETRREGNGSESSTSAARRQRAPPSKRHLRVWERAHYVIHFGVALQDHKLVDALGVPGSVCCRCGGGGGRGKEEGELHDAVSVWSPVQCLYCTVYYVLFLTPNQQCHAVNLK